MTATSVEFHGGDAAAADLRRWADQLAAEVNKASAPLAARVAGIVSGRVPHLSGQLAGSVESRLVDDGVELSMGDGLAYAGWIEFGGSRGRDYIAQGRYLYPSMLDAEDEYQQTAETTSADTVSRFAWSTPAS